VLGLRERALHLAGDRSRQEPHERLSAWGP
jgi:hypothetical protein